MKEKIGITCLVGGFVLAFWAGVWIFANRYYGNELFRLESAGAAFSSIITSDWKLESFLLTGILMMLVGEQIIRRNRNS